MKRSRYPGRHVRHGGAEASTWSVAVQHVGLSVQESGMSQLLHPYVGEANEKLRRERAKLPILQGTR